MMRNNPPLLQGKRLAILIAASVIGLFVIGGCATALLVAKSGDAKGDVHSFVKPAGSEQGTMLFSTMLFDDLGQQVTDVPELDPSTTQLQAIPTDSQSSPGEPQHVGALQGSQIEPTIFQIGSIALTRKKLTIIALMAVAVLLLSVVSGVTCYIFYRNDFDLGTVRSA